MTDDTTVRREVDALEATAAGAATWTSLDAAGRSRYNQLARKLGEEIWARYKAGNLSAADAARLAQQMRNEIMTIIRARSSPYGRARAAALKQRGKTLEELADKYARPRFQRGFYDLSAAEQGGVYEEIIRAAGRPNAAVNAEARMLGRLSKGLWVVTAIVIIWDVSTASDKVEAAMRDLAAVALGVAGSMAAGAMAGVLFGPVGAVIGGIVGGILGGLLLDTLFDWFKAHAPTPDASDAMLRALT